MQMLGYSGYTRQVHSMVQKPEKYGLSLSPEAKRRLFPHKAPRRPQERAERKTSSYTANVPDQILNSFEKACTQTGEEPGDALAKLMEKYVSAVMEE